MKRLVGTLMVGLLCSAGMADAQAAELLPVGAHSPQAQGGYLVWLEPTADRPQRAYVRKDGVTNVLKLRHSGVAYRDSGEPFFRLGVDSTGAAVASYPVCAHRRCRVWTHNLGTGAERVVARTRFRNCARILDTAVWGHAVAFNRALPHRDGKRHRCGPDGQDEGDYGAYLLDRGKRPRLLGKDQYLYDVDLSTDSVAWLGRQFSGSGEYSAIYVFDRKRSRTCQVDAGADGFEESGSYRESVVRAPSVVGRWTYWRSRSYGPTDKQPPPPESNVLMRIAGCKARHGKAPAGQASSLATVLDEGVLSYPQADRIAIDSALPAFAPITLTID